MTRFSLETYRENNDDDSLSSSSLDASEASSVASSSSSYSTKYDWEEEAHPLGFGTTRFGLYDDSDDEFDDMEDLGAFFRAPLRIHIRKPILNNSKETGLLMRHGYDQKRHSRDIIQRHNNEQDPLWMGPLVDRMDRIAILVKAASIIPPDNGTGIDRMRIPPSNPNTFQILLDAAAEQRRNERQTKFEMERYEKELLEKQRADANLLLSIIEREASQARTIIEEEEKEEQAMLEAEEALQRRQDLEAKAKRDEEERVEQERVAQEERDEKIRLAKEAKEQKDVERREEKLKEKELAEAKKTEHVTKAQKMVAKLDHVRASIETFEKSKDRSISKRRLQMKKIARGKMNTLSHDREKVVTVVNQVVEAIKHSVDEDIALRQQMQAGNTAIQKEMARGSRYLIDLIASTVVVRVQAEGFNGTRGDGFPLAHMLAYTSTNLKEDFSYILMAHIYAVCPVAIPTLPSPAHGCSELELMESLGMQKDKKGEYETFDRFLTRTEGLVSIVAEIMASKPSDHCLFGGHKGALLWLQRFLALLPPDQSPLPLLTAPVLVAFLTAAGHLLANKFPDQFRPMLDKISSDISKRLDSSAIGQPSSTRLSKLLSGGFDSFKNELPQGAIRDLYDTSPSSSSSTIASGHTTKQNSAQPTGAEPSKTFGGSQQTVPATPFGGSSSTKPSDDNSAFGVSTSSNPFGGGVSQSTMAPSPFGTTNAPAPSPFGTKTPAPSPFGATGATPAAPFGATSGTSQESTPMAFSGNNQTPFGANASAFGTSASTNPFGGGASETAMTQGSAAPSPFGSTNVAAPSPFSSSNAATAPNPFGASQQSAPSGFPLGNTNTTPFGNSSAPSNAPFGASSSTTPFGAGAAPAPSPFGNPQSTVVPSPFGGPATTAPNHSPFGAAPTTTFGFGLAPSNTQPSSTPFGGKTNQKSKKGPCRFFAQGRCNKGDRCEYSHEMPGQAQSNNNTPFGGGGWNNSSTNNNNGTKKQPCKFFAQGKCKFGANCKYSHDMNSMSASQSFGGSGVNGSSGFGSNRPW